MRYRLTMFVSLFCIMFCQNPAAEAAGESRPQRNRDRPAAFETLYATHCAVCHGDQLQGSAQGVPLVGVSLRKSDTVETIAEAISQGNPDAGMPAWKNVLTPVQRRQLAIFIAENRKGITSFGDFKVGVAFELPTQPIETKRHNFRLESVIDGLDRYPYSIASLPDGRVLLTEKTHGLTLISRDGKQSPLIKGAPVGHAMEMARDTIQFGTGYVMDVALHPNFARNGWVYLHIGDRCSDCNKVSRQINRPVSMNKLLRGRLKDDRWGDEETIWEVSHDFYTPDSEMAAGGRITFDPTGYVFLSVGMKAGYRGIQDLAFPYGKIHRVHDDGRLPDDNPFLNHEGAIKSTWTLGHRSPQGLAFDPKTGELWGTEMGPRGGDEVNLLRPGRNYGWPLFSKGVHYSGAPVNAASARGVAERYRREVTINDIEQPVVDLTPGPAVSSLVVYDGAAFPNWRGNLLVGTLKGTELYRIELEGQKAVARETILGPLARIRDIEVEADGHILLLLEHRTNSQIVRLRPVPIAAPANLGHGQQTPQ